MPSKGHKRQQSAVPAQLSIANGQCFAEPLATVENKAFGGVGYEIKKKLIWHYTNLSSAWASLWPPLIGGYLLIKWAEAKMEAEHRSHRD